MQIHSPPLPPVSERFASILADLAKAVSAQQAGSGFFLAFAGVIWSRIMTVRRVVGEIIRAIGDGTVRPFRARGPGKAGARRLVSKGTRERIVALAATWCRMPKRPGWLCAKGGHEVRSYASQLAHLLTDPEMRRLLAASPRLGMALRPLCRMLGIDPKLYENVEAPGEVVEVAPPDVEPPQAAAKARVEDNEAGIPWWQQKWAH